MSHFGDIAVQWAAVLAALAVVARLLVYPLVRWGRGLAAKVELIEAASHSVRTVERRVSDLGSVRAAIEDGVKAMQKIQGSAEDRITLVEEENAHRVKWERSHDLRHGGLDVRLTALEACIRELTDITKEKTQP